ncbi:transcriptional regulator [Planotetraspora silvatica]|uniref:Transcriptional regulator n=1 Tax=Planotetraspora silvatica TaxID=234614 RepID=A0A8J3UU59_9ACTN|nr:transcriptional regulator [Planotetraspora silvatica]
MGLIQIDDRRRTPGLRRQEVASLAAVSLDYYIRLEQGRECRPSDQVLGALARVLQLGPEAAEHLHRLAHSGICDRGRPQQTDRVHPDVLRLLDSWDDKPAFVMNHLLDVLAQNSLFAALQEGLEHTDNIMRFAFLNPAVRELWVDWEAQARLRVAHLRAAAGADCSPTLLELVEELSDASEDFRRMWAHHDVCTDAGASMCVHHPDAGDLTLRYQAFSVDCAPGQRLIVFQTDPGSPSERALAKLAGLRHRQSSKSGKQGVPWELHDLDEVGQVEVAGHPATGWT